MPNSKVKTYAAQAATSPLAPFEITRREPGTIMRFPLVPSDRSPVADRREIRSVESRAVESTYMNGFTGHRGSTATLSNPSSCPTASTSA